MSMKKLSFSLCLWSVSLLAQQPPGLPEPELYRNLPPATYPKGITPPKSTLSTPLPQAITAAAPVAESTWLLNLGWQYTNPITNYNNLLPTVFPVAAGTVFGSLKKSDGTASGVKLTLNSALAGGGNVGSCSGGLYPNAAANSDWWVRDNNVLSAKFGGLSTAKKYTVIFFSNSGTYDATSIFTINGVAKSLYGKNNCTNTVSFENLVPNAQGEVTFTLSRNAGFFQSGVNVIELRQFSGAAPPPTVARQDSLALVDLFNSTDGANWSKKANWLTGPANTWQGVMVEGGRVTGLSLSYANLSGTLPATIGNLSQLKTLEMEENISLYGTIPAGFYNLTNLEILKAGVTRISGSLSEDIGRLTKLKTLYFYQSALSGNIPKNLGKLTNLEYLALNTNRLEGTIPDSISGLTRLLDLRLANNQLTGPLPANIGNLRNLFYLDLSNNSLSGTLPSSLSQLTKLQTLNLFGNKLTGNLPSLGAAFDQLVILQLGSNSFTGNIPADYGSMSKVTFFYLPLNNLSGAIPSTLSALTRLSALYLSDCGLSGQVPDIFSGMTNLSLIVLGNNQFSGTFPSSVNGLANLSTLFLRGNRFTAIPDFSQHPNKARLHIEVQNNRLDFGSLEPNFSASGVALVRTLVYSPQDSVAVLDNGVSQLSGNVSGTNNVYQWRKAGIAIPGATAKTLTLSATTTPPGFYDYVATNTRVPGLTLISKQRELYPPLPPTVEDGNLGFARIVSQELSNINGSMIIHIRLYADTNLTWQQPITVSKPASWTVGPITYPSKTSLIKGDSVDFRVQLNYSTGSVPFFPQDISFSFNTIRGANRQNQKAIGKVFFTPYNTTEIWSTGDFYSLNRVWIERGSIPDTTRRFIAKTAIPVSDILPTDAIIEEWQDDFQWKQVPGLAYMVQMRGVDPSIIEQQNQDDGPDSTLSVTSFRIGGRTFSGTVQGRLVSLIRNDLGFDIVIPLSGVLVKLKEMDKLFNEEFGEATTDINGNFTITYSKSQSALEGRTIELFLKIKAKNREYDIRVVRNGTFNPVYESSVGLGSHGQSANINQGNIFLNEGHFRVLNWSVKAYVYVEGQGTNLPGRDIINRGLRIIPYTGDGGAFTQNQIGQLAQPTIRLNTRNTEHENTIYHEMGHFIMWSVQGRQYISNSSGTHGYESESNPGCCI
jgi:Leucine-rich repeat (LRR) protein